MKKFISKSFYKGHITFYQDLRRIELCVSASHGRSDEYNCLFQISIIFWSIEIAWRWEWLRDQDKSTKTEEEISRLLSEVVKRL